MAENYFPGDSYTTPQGQHTFFASRFPSLYFTWKVMGIIRHDSKLAGAGLYHGKEWAEGSYGTLKALECAGIEFEAEGLNNISASEGPCVFIGNHMSTLETFVLPCLIQPRKEVTFIVKSSLLGYPWFGTVLKSRDPVVVKRENPREDFTTVMEEGVKRLNRGVSIIVFPQSTRCTEFDPGQCNTLGIKLAKKAGAPVVPLALRTDAWKVGWLVKDYGGLDTGKRVRFAFGAPLRIQGNGKAEHAAVCDFIVSRLKAWGLPGESAICEGVAQ